MYLGIFYNYYKGTNNKWVLVNKEYYSYSLLEEVKSSFNKYNSLMKRTGYEVITKGNKTIFISKKNKVVSKYYKCKPVILN